MTRRLFLAGLTPALFMFQLLPWQWKVRAMIPTPAALSFMLMDDESFVIDGEG